MNRLSALWERIKPGVTLADLLADVTGKCLVALGLGALLAPHLLSWAWGLIGVGMVLSLTVKLKYCRRLCSRKAPDGR